MLKKLASTHVLFFSFLKIILLNSEKTVEFYSTSAFSYFNQPSQESTHQETDTPLNITCFLYFLPFENLPSRLDQSGLGGFLSVGFDIVHVVFFFFFFK